MNMRLSLLLWLIAALCASVGCEPPTSIDGRRCKTDDDCKDDDGDLHHYCRTETEPHVCVPGKTPVKPRENRPPYVRSALIVAVRDTPTPVTGQFVFTDPDGDAVTIADGIYQDSGGDVDAGPLTVFPDGTFSFLPVLVQARSEIISHYDVPVTDGFHDDVFINVTALLVLDVTDLHAWQGSETANVNDTFTDDVSWSPATSATDTTVFVGATRNVLRVVAAASVADYLAGPGADTRLDADMTVTGSRVLSSVLPCQEALCAGTFIGTVPLKLGGATASLHLLQGGEWIAPSEVRGSVASDDAGVANVGAYSLIVSGDAALANVVLAADGVVAVDGVLSLQGDLSGMTGGDVYVGTQLQSTGTNMGADVRFWFDRSGTTDIVADTLLPQIRTAKENDVHIVRAPRITSLSVSRGLSIAPGQVTYVDTLELRDSFLPSADDNGVVLAGACVHSPGTPIPSYVLCDVPPPPPPTTEGEGEGEGEGEEGEGEGEGNEGEGEGEAEGEGEGEGEGEVVAAIELHCPSRPSTQDDVVATLVVVECLENTPRTATIELREGVHFVPATASVADGLGLVAQLDVDATDEVTFRWLRSGATNLHFVMGPNATVRDNGTSGSATVDVQCFFEGDSGVHVLRTEPLPIDANDDTYVVAADITVTSAFDVGTLYIASGATLTLQDCGDGCVVRQKLLSGGDIVSTGDEVLTVRGSGGGDGIDVGGRVDALSVAPYVNEFFEVTPTTVVVAFPTRVNQMTMGVAPGPEVVVSSHLTAGGLTGTGTLTMNYAADGGGRLDVTAAWDIDASNALRSYSGVVDITTDGAARDLAYTPMMEGGCLAVNGEAAITVPEPAAWSDKMQTVRAGAGGGALTLPPGPVLDLRVAREIKTTNDEPITATTLVARAGFFSAAGIVEVESGGICAVADAGCVCPDFDAGGAVTCPAP